MRTAGKSCGKARKRTKKEMYLKGARRLGTRDEGVGILIPTAGSKLGSSLFTQTWREVIQAPSSGNVKRKGLGVFQYLAGKTSGTDVYNCNRQERTHRKEGVDPY